MRFVPIKTDDQLDLQAIGQFGPLWPPLTATQKPLSGPLLGLGGAESPVNAC
jgi:hypothetical protein